MKRETIVLAILAAMLVSACASNKQLAKRDESSRNSAIPICENSPVTAWQKGKGQDWAVAREFEQKIKAGDIPIQTESAVARHLGAQGKAETVEAWKGSYVGLPPPLLSSRSPKLRHSVELAGDLAATRLEPTRIFVEVSDADRLVVKTWLARGVARARPRRFRPVIEFLPMRRGDVPFIRIEPVDQNQFSPGPSQEGG